MPELTLDVVLALMVLGVALRALHARDLFSGVVHYIVFGMLLAVAWVRLEAPDLALAEAAIGAGLTGALLLDAVRTLPPRSDAGAHEPRQKPAPGAAGLEVGRPQAIMAALVILPLAVLLFHAVLELPPEPGGLTSAVGAQLATHPVSHPVTAVLLDFRAYDTWLEVMVLLLAVTAALLVRRTRDLRDVPGMNAGSPVLHWGVRFALPIMILVGGYLLWLGTHAPGGAFQAGAVLAAAGVLAFHAGAFPRAVLARPLFGWLLSVGALAFLAAAVVPLVTHGTLLRMSAGWVILAVESLVTIAIATTLTALFIAARPVSRERAGGAS
jgi:multisubunit Na+/H+ antiporter MnhB subunit